MRIVAVVVGSAFVAAGGLFWYQSHDHRAEAVKAASGPSQATRSPSKVSSPSLQQLKRAVTVWRAHPSPAAAPAIPAGTVDLLVPRQARHLEARRGLVALFEREGVDVAAGLDVADDFCLEQQMLSAALRGMLADELMKRDAGLSPKEFAGLQDLDFARWRELAQESMLAFAPRIRALIPQTPSDFWTLLGDQCPKADNSDVDAPGK